MTDSILFPWQHPRLRMPRFRAWRVVFGVLPLALVGAALGGQPVYESQGPGGTLVYSNERLRAGARLALPGNAGESSASTLATASDNRAVKLPPNLGRATPASRRSLSRAKARPELDRLIAVLSRHYGVDPHLVRAVVEVESNFNPNARSPKGATGLMQLMPATAARYHNASLYDPVKNIEAGILYLRDLLRMFDGNAELALAGYNAGEGAVLKYQRQIPPYAETQAYVPKVLAAWKRNRADPNLPRISSQTVELP